MKKSEKHLKEKYSNFGPTFAQEKLKEIDEIKINKETIRQIMVKIGLWKIKSRKMVKTKHFWRARKDNFGEMIQFDGSYHCWFGEFKTCLLCSIDDSLGLCPSKANEFLVKYIPKFNERFVVVPQKKTDLYKEISGIVKEKLP